MSGMFYGCSGLKEVPLFDTSKVTDMYDMFYGCSGLKEIPHLDTSKVTDMNNMFSNCSSLEYILENFPLYDWSNTNSELLKENYPELFIWSEN
jgi:surface protein